MKQNKPEDISVGVHAVMNMAMIFVLSFLLATTAWLFDC